MARFGPYSLKRSGYTRRTGRPILVGRVGLYSWGRSPHTRRMGWVILMGQIGLYSMDFSGDRGAAAVLRGGMEASGFVVQSDFWL